MEGNLMAIPKYYEMYKSFLEVLKDEKEHSIYEVKQSVSKKMCISSEEQNELLPSGKQFKFDNRIGWTRTYLKKAGLIDSPKRGIFKLTKEGKSVLDEKPSLIDDSYLMKYESFREFIKPGNGNTETPNALSTEETPQDTLDNAFTIINQTLSDDILTEIMKQSPAFFERLVVQLLEKMGYGGSIKDAGSVVGKSGDEGIDGIVREDKLGFSHIYIQAKRWEPDKTIGRPEIQKFVGALAGQGATKGLFITTAQFSKEAFTYAEKQHTTKIVLVDGISLSKLMIEYDLGVSLETVYPIKKIDMDFFNDGNI